LTLKWFTRFNEVMLFFMEVVQCGQSLQKTLLLLTMKWFYTQLQMTGHFSYVSQHFIQILHTWPNIRILNIFIYILIFTIYYSFVNIQTFISALAYILTKVKEWKLKISFFFFKFKKYKLCQKSSEYDHIQTWPKHSFDISVHAI
jgi:hypothetical protein